MGRFADYDPAAEERPKLDASCIRIARLDDAETLYAISAERGDESDDEPNLPNVISRIRGELEGIARDAPWCVYVAELAGEVIAYGRVRDLTHAEDGLPTECPEGWYLTGVIVRPPFRRRGLGALLTQARIEWVGERATEVHYVTNKRNVTSIALHARFGFEPTDAEFAYPRAALERGAGRLYRLALR